ncbi:MAG: hypothetical protein ACOYNQ_07295, partial [Burkholderiales bacterium]
MRPSTVFEAAGNRVQAEALPEPFALAAAETLLQQFEGATALVLIEQSGALIFTFAIAGEEAGEDDRAAVALVAANLQIWRQPGFGLNVIAG